ncbi:MAG: amidohydrolase family protein, partial [Arenimonas sp.]|nr:amidohydrolase family protein [Arenimonas sp.]
MRRTCLALALSLAVVMPASAATHLLTAARIHTGDAGRPVAEAMAWDEEGNLLALGSASELRQRFPEAREHAQPGAVVIPGLIDAHAHVMGLGFALLRADLVDAASKEEVISRLKAFEATLPPGAWLLGRGWDQNDWPGKAFPTAADLDAAFPERPVWLERVDGHAGWANSAALRAVTRDLSGDWQPEGGRILRDAQGRATGVFIDTAAALVDAVVPAPDEALRAEALERSLEAAVKHGLTGVHDMGVSLADLGLMRRFADEGRLPLRIRAY